MTEPERLLPVVRGVAETITPLLLLENVPWAVVGSTSSFLNGVPLEPHDVDILTTARGARLIDSMLEPWVDQPVTYSGNQLYTSHFGVYEVDGVVVEVMGDLAIHCRDVSLQVTPQSLVWRRLLQLLVLDQRVYTVPVPWQVVGTFVEERLDRTRLLLRWLERRGELDEIKDFMDDHGLKGPPRRRLELMIQEVRSASEIALGLKGTFW
ncbi:MAG: hypothetical protein WEB00_01540 [Dehalococcoidia bacterium]